MSGSAAEYLEQLRGRMSGVSAFNRPKRKKIEKSRQNITTTRFDERAWNRERKGNETLDRDITDLYVGHGNRTRDESGNIPDLSEDYDYDENGNDREAYDNAPELVQDLWQALYKPVPRFRKKKEVFKDAGLNRRILEEVMSHPDYERLHDLTMTDQTMATMATHTFMNTLREIIRRNQEQVQESNGTKQQIIQGTFSGQPGQGQGQGGGGNGAGQQPGDGPQEDEQDENQPGGGGQGQGQQGQPESAEGEGQGDGEGESDERPDPLGHDAGGSGHDQYDEDDKDLNSPDGPGMDEESDGKGEDHEGDPDTIGDDDPLDLDDLDRAIHKAMEEAADEFDELDGLRKGIGLEDGQWGQMPADRRISILNTLRTPQMKVLADIVGRMKKFAMSMQAQKIIDAPEEAFDVETGNDLRHLLRSEYVYLGTEETKPIFYSKFMEKELLQYKLRGRENAGKGPIFVCIDKSYSMRGDPFNWAMAVAEALRRICAEQKRDYYATFFGTNNDRHRFDFPKGKTDFDKVLEFLQSVANGGPLRVDQRIATPNGWKAIGDSQVGDLVFGPDGKPTRIIGVFPQGELDLKRVHFEDGSSVVCDDSHLWTVERKVGRDWRRETLHLSEILEYGLTFKDGRYRFRVPITEPLDLPEVELPVEPYLLGYMLGDGSFQDSPTITTSEDEEPWRDGLPKGLVITDKEKRPGQPRQYRISTGRRSGRRDQNPLVEALKGLGLWRKRDHEKFIPKVYLRASKDQRLALLQGLLDTDGSANVPGNIFYHTTSHALAEGVVGLMQSLGGLATISTHKDKREGNEHWREVHTVNCRIPQWLTKPYRLKRRMDTFEPRRRPLTRPILKVTYEGPGQAICIKVDREDGLFLTEGMVVTHNTEFSGVLTEALERTEEYGKQGAEKADIVFLTDGQARLTDEWIADFNERRAEHGTRVFSVFIGGARDYYGAAPVKLLESFSDVVIPVRELSDRAVADIFKKV